MVEALQKRRASSFEIYKQVQLKLITSIFSIIIFLVRLLIVIISAVALYVAHYCHADEERKNLLAAAKKQLRSCSENEESADLLSNWESEGNAILKQSNTPRENKRNWKYESCFV